MEGFGCAACIWRLEDALQIDSRSNKRNGWQKQYGIQQPELQKSRVNRMCSYWKMQEWEKMFLIRLEFQSKTHKTLSHIDEKESQMRVTQIICTMRQHGQKRKSKRGRPNLFRLLSTGENIWKRSGVRGKAKLRQGGCRTFREKQGKCWRH